MADLTKGRRKRTEDRQLIEDKKKLRNRLSQQAFRKRQNAYIHELEKRMERTDKSDDERIAALEEENRELRRQLVAFVNRVESAHATLHSLSVAMNKTLGGNASQGSGGSVRTQETSANPSLPLLDIQAPSAPQTDVESERESALGFHTLETMLQPQPTTVADVKSSHKITRVITSHDRNLYGADFAAREVLDMQALDSFTFQESEVSPDSTQPPTFNTASGSASDQLGLLNSDLDDTTQLDNALPSVVGVNYVTDYKSDSNYTFSSPNPAAQTSTAMVPSGQAQASQGINTMPGVWSYHYQMGPGVYSNALNNSRLDSGRLRPSNSYWSDHIAGLRSCLQETWRDTHVLQSSPVVLDRLNLSVSLMLAMFNSLSRPLAMAWYSPTKFYCHIADLMMWQMNPTKEMYTRLHLRYRPSALQLTETYPSIIDWCPFSDLRDKLVLFHAANPFIDQIVCDIATAYVVETDLSTLVNLKTPVFGYVRVWDLIRAMGEKDSVGQNPSSRGAVETSRSTFPPSRTSASSESNADNDTDGLSLPAPSIEALFQNKNYARLAFKALRMDDGIAIYRIDPALFVKYPELYDPDSQVIASGTPLLPFKQETIPIPISLDDSTLHIYHHFARWSFDAICRAGVE